MSNKTLIVFATFQAINHGLEIIRLRDKTKGNLYIDEIRVPRMLDVMGNKYYLTNVNRYLDPNNDDESKISVFVNRGGVIADVLIEWLNHCNVNWKEVEDLKDENIS